MSDHGADLQAELTGGLSHRLTAGQIARVLGIDLKTVHNWAERGKLRGPRTKGRHLRVLHAEVVRIARRRGSVLPAEFTDRQLQVALVGYSADAPAPGVTSFPHFFDGLLAVSSGDFDVAVLPLERLSGHWLAELMAALHKRPLTLGIGLVGVGADAEAGAQFRAAGGDVWVPAMDGLPGALRFISGQASAPSGVEPRARRSSGFIATVDVPGESQDCDDHLKPGHYRLASGC
jgi:excisionase family DNA binding protein